MKRLLEGAREGLRGWTWLAVVALVAVALRVWGLGQDQGWDLLNYHLYAPHAWLNDRLDIDIAPGQVQSFHNPFLDLPLWLLIRAASPGWLVTSWLSLPAVIAVFGGLLLMRRVGVSVPGLLAAAALMVTGAAATASIGTSSNDWFIAGAAIAALAIAVLRGLDADGWRAWFVAGLLLGAATGLKLTGAAYCVGIGMAALCSASPRLALPRTAMVALGGILGVALTLGPWAWTMWERFGNPLFPYFNHYFASPMAQPWDFSDPRFLPRSWLDAAMMPWNVAIGSSAYSEPFLRDPRILLGLLALPVLAWRMRTDAERAWLRVLAIFFLATLAVWLARFGVYRYLIGMELISCIVLVVALERGLPRKIWLQMSIAGALLVLMWHATLTASWGRQAFLSPMIWFASPPIEADALVILAGDEPLGAAAAFLPEGIAVISVFNNFMRPSHCDGLQALAQQRLGAHRGPIYWMQQPPMEDASVEALGQLGLQREGPCLDWPNTLQQVEFCPLVRHAAPTEMARCPQPTD